MKNYFKGMSHEMKKYILDANRNGITESVDNLLRPYIEHGGKSKEKASLIQYSRKNILFFFLFIKVSCLLLLITEKMKVKIQESWRKNNSLN